jgi:hypothetical protein
VVANTTLVYYICISIFELNEMKFSIFKKIFSVFGGGKDDPKAALVANNSEETESTQIDIVRENSRDLEIIRESQSYLKQLNEFVKLTKEHECNSLFVEVLETAKKIHDKCLEREEVPLKRLEEYHSHFTDTFIVTFEAVLTPLYPKPEIDVSLKSNFGLEEEKEEKFDETKSDLEHHYHRDVEINRPPEEYDIYKLIDELKEDEKYVNSDKLSNGYGIYINEVFKLKDIVREKNPDMVKLCREDNNKDDYSIIFLGLSEKDNNPFFEESYKVICKSSGDVLRRVDNVFKVDLKESVKIDFLDVTEYKSTSSLKDRLGKIANKNKNKHKV